jgi:two-component system sensor histidine kinase/response regulator
MLSQLDEGNEIQNSSIGLMSFMIQDLLDFSQIKSGKFRKNISRFNVRDSIKKIMDMQRSKADEQGIDFFCSFPNIAEKECEAHLGMKSPFVKTDQDRFNQVLLGLQSNAIKFTESGKVEIRVSIEEKNQRECLSV